MRKKVVVDGPNGKCWRWQDDDPTEGLPECPVGEVPPVEPPTGETPAVELKVAGRKVYAK